MNWLQKITERNDKEARRISKLIVDDVVTLIQQYNPDFSVVSFVQELNRERDCLDNEDKKNVHVFNKSKARNILMEYILTIVEVIFEELVFFISKRIFTMNNWNELKEIDIGMWLEEDEIIKKIKENIFDYPYDFIDIFRLVVSRIKIMHGLGEIYRRKDGIFLAPDVKKLFLIKKLFEIEEKKMSAGINAPDIVIS